MVSAVVLTKNEEKNIQDCLESLAWCDEVIVVDDNSTDNTRAIAENKKARVIIHALSNFAEQRNFALDKAKNEWVLFIDADERVPKSLQEEITKNLQLDRSANGYFIKRSDFIFGKKLRFGETANVRLLRLGRKDAGKWEGKVHETWNIQRNVKQLENAILHYPHQTISEFLSEINRYSDMRAQELYEKKAHTNFLSIILYPKAKFLQNYFMRLGFLDGIEGIIFALMMSFHSFLVRGKLWLLWRKE